VAHIERVSAGRAHIRYRLQDGTLVPGVTTVLAVLSKPGLIEWANDLGLKGISTRGYVDGLARIGTLAHQMIEADLGAEHPDLGLYSAEEIDRAENSYIKWLDWRKRHSVAPVWIEKPLVSERLRYGGTLDCLARIDGRLEILDIKTARRIYDEHLIQVSAYHRLASEHGQRAEAVRIVQVGRTEDEGFSEHVVPAQRLAPYWRIFACALSIYRLQHRIREEG